MNKRLNRKINRILLMNLKLSNSLTHVTSKLCSFCRIAHSSFYSVVTRCESWTPRISGLKHTIQSALWLKNSLGCLSSVSLYKSLAKITLLCTLKSLRLEFAVPVSWSLNAVNIRITSPCISRLWNILEVSLWGWRPKAFKAVRIWRGSSRFMTSKKLK